MFNFGWGIVLTSGWDFGWDIVLPLVVIWAIVQIEKRRGKFGFFGKLLRFFVGNYEEPWYEKPENQEIVKEIEDIENQRNHEY